MIAKSNQKSKTKKMLDVGVVLQKNGSTLTNGRSGQMTERALQRIRS